MLVGAYWPRTFAERSFRVPMITTTGRGRAQQSTRADHGDVKVAKDDGSVPPPGYHMVSIVDGAGKLPGSVLTRYDLLGTYIRRRLQYAY